MVEPGRRDRLLAQLHQLRGRIGRGQARSTCLLLYQSPLSETARARLQILRETEDGFRIAEEDLKLRGAGELLGTRQSGLPEFHLVDPAVHGDLIAIAERFPDVFCSVGTHPHHADEELDIGTADLVARTRHPKVVAIGEAGLDYFRNNSPRDAQAQSFRQHIQAARATGLPLVIHSRDCDADMAQVLREESGKGAFPAVLHCFTGGRDLAFSAIDLGHYVSFTGILTFKNSDALREVAAALPADRIMVETDAPYLAPGKHRGRRNEPSYVVEVAKVLAETRGVTLEEISRQTTENFFRLFSKVPASACR